ncbi:16557_t:CDS:2, partial [Acaulospora morrowiae]
NVTPLYSQRTMELLYEDSGQPQVSNTAQNKVEKIEAPLSTHSVSKHHLFQTFQTCPHRALSNLLMVIEAVNVFVHARVLVPIPAVEHVVEAPDVHVLLNGIDVVLFPEVLQAGVLLEAETEGGDPKVLFEVVIEVAEGGEPVEPDPSHVLGVFNLSLRTTEKDLQTIFERYGRVKQVTIVYDHRSDRSRGFGFVYMNSVEEASMAKEKTNGMEINGRNMRVDYSLTQRPHTPTPGEYMGDRPSQEEHLHAPGVEAGQRTEGGRAVVVIHIGEDHIVVLENLEVIPVELVRD